MRPGSEIHSALDLCESELARLPAGELGTNNLSIARDVLAWVAGAHWTELTDGPNPWLAAFLMDDPPKIDNTPPEVN